MADWDDDDFDPDAGDKLAAVKSDKWEGEDEEEEVKDNWDDEEEEKPKPVEVKVKNPTKKSDKKSLNKRLKEIEEKERLEKEKSRNHTPEEKLAEKLRNQKLAEQSDLEVAKDTFGVQDDKSASIDSFQCSTKEQFKKMEELMNKKIISFKSSPHYMYFLETMFVNICADLSSEQVRKLSSPLSAIASEKLKQEKEKTKKVGKKGKAKLAGSSKGGAGDDMLDYSMYNDFDDFM